MLEEESSRILLIMFEKFIPGILPGTMYFMLFCGDSANFRKI
jgi:hypothetical protein